MKGITNWSYKPFCPLNHLEDLKKPHILALAPFETGFSMEWCDKNENGAHTLCVKEREGKSLLKYALNTKYM